jgi:hypothetical protein
MLGAPEPALSLSKGPDFETWESMQQKRRSMTDSRLLITNMAILACIFLAGLVAKMFARKDRKAKSR